jgi:hypothetical protein
VTASPAGLQCRRGRSSAHTPYAGAGPGAKPAPLLLLLPLLVPVWCIGQWWPGIGVAGAVLAGGDVVVVGRVTLVVGELVVLVLGVVLDDAALANAAPPPANAPTTTMAAIALGIRVVTSFLLSGSRPSMRTGCRSAVRAG